MSLSKESLYVLHKKNDDVSSVWNHFMVARDGCTAKCKRCPAILKTLGGSTKGLHTHLLSKHEIRVATVKPSTSTSTRQYSEEPPLKRKTTSIADYFVQTYTLDDILAQMTAVDGFPFSVFSTSKDLRALLLFKGYTDLPKTASSIRKRVLNYSHKIRKEIKVELTALKDEGQRFSLSFDEWTSCSNKRYMNVNIHSEKKFWSLGLIRINESLKAETCVHILEERLSQFDISLNADIVAIITDGPNVMLKVGRLVNTEHQVCFAHGIHLAVCDLLYTQNRSVNSASEPLNEELDDDVDDEDDEDLESGLIIETGVSPDLTNDQNINDVIKKIRKVVLIFKRASLKNDTILQKYVKKEHGKEMVLLLDCKTRWNSLLTMLERFSLLKVCVQKALIDLNNPVHLDESDFHLINEIVKVLTPVNLTLCRSDANLCTADAAFKFIFKQLSGNPSILASKLKNHLHECIKDRRRKELSGVLSYLQNPQNDDVNLDDQVSDLFSYPNKTFIKKQIVSLNERLNPKNNMKDKANESHSHAKEMQICDPIATNKSNLTLKEILQLEIEISMKIFTPEPFTETELSKIIKKEMDLFEVTSSNRGYNLEQTYCLLTIPPTSVEPERAFSSAAYMCNKLRSRLGDETLDALLFLRSYFQNLNKAKV